jgi:hypothetical protein
MDCLGIASIETGITHADDFALAGQVEPRAHHHGSAHQSGRHIVAWALDGSLTNLADTMHGREPIDLRLP